jgi:tetratricopeptide (TPR) repeat protein
VSRRRFKIKPGLAAEILLAVAVAGFAAYLALRPSAPEIPQPANLDKLDPQLRDYLQQKIGWTREKPRHSERHSTLGLVYAANGLWNEARLSFENAARLNPREPLAWLYVGLAIQETGDAAAAMNAFRETTLRFPEFAPGFYRLGNALLRAGETAPASSAFERLTALAPREWRGYAGLGEARLRSGQPAEAVKLLEKAVSLDSRARTAHHLLGQAYQALGRKDDAELELALGRNPTDGPMPDTWSGMAAEHIHLLQSEIQMAGELADEGHPREAIEILAKAFVEHPDNVSLMNQLAIILIKSGQPNKAYAVLEQALQKDPRSVPALVTLSFCYEKLEKHDKSLAVAEQAIALAPNIAQPHIAKANTLLAMERDDEALAALDTALRADPQNAGILIQMGDVLWRNLNRLNDAKERYLSARTLDPVSAPLHARLADLQLQLGEITEARATINRLRRIAPELPDLTILDGRLQKLESK